MDIQEQERQRRAREVAASVVGGGSVRPEDVAIELLGGMTNRNYLVKVAGETYVVRIPGEGTEEYLDRKADGQAAQITSDLGVNAHLVHYDTAKGVQITKFIENGKTMSAELFQDPDAVRRAALSFRKLHTSGAKFHNRFDEKVIAQEYLDMLRSKGARFPDGYERVQSEADAIREVLTSTCGELAPCHNDPAPENLVDTGERVHILDWEFGGNNDPFWDLADLSVETGFTEEQDRILLEAYLGRPPKESEYGRMVLHKSLVFLLWTLWGVIQETNKNPRPAYHFASFWDYAMDRFTRCQQIMNADNFRGLVEVVRTGG
ncbi:choline kinase family protein [Hyphomicrobium sp. 99]|uniref:choline kinase family protein n=1 Tax=Hyphomicrobium sp. 99 TaxID=1163419 RepID=UPI0005F840F6|nr:choline kinase family protein [Hyphomicrobium sp. 99]